MSDKMKPIPFPEMLGHLLWEYNENGKFYGVPVVKNEQHIPIGPAAGPHTQLAGNILAAYAAGSEWIELKTVQILTGEELHIEKPCIYAGNEVFNTEWSTELTIQEATEEYMKAFLLIQILSREFGLTRIEDIHFIISVGYDLAGIQSYQVDGFLENMKHAGNMQEWKRNINYVKEHLSDFSHLTVADLEEIEKADCIADTVTLSTMHGCLSTEIEKIAMYLLEEKQFHVFIKMNPTLIGYQEAKKILKQKGYSSLTFSEEGFARDITLAMAEEIILHCQITAKKNHRQFGAKMTNTFPVAQDGRLSGEQMYLSGRALYPMAVKAAALLAQRLNGKVCMSYSGGADQENIKELLESGLKPITVSSILLKTGGYKNITTLIKKAEECILTETLSASALHELSVQAQESIAFDYQESKVFATKKDYSSLCAKCSTCVDVCPNRANIRVETKDGDYVIHRDRLCNECGCCSTQCPLGHNPYREKFTVFEEKTAFEDSSNCGMLYTDEHIVYRNYKKDAITASIENFFKLEKEVSHEF